MTFRPYLPSDDARFLSWLPSGKAAFHRLCAGVFPFPPTAEALSSFQKRTETEPGTRWIAEDENGVPCGHFRLQKDTAHDRIHFSMILIDPERRGQGLGKTMLREALSVLGKESGAGTATLWVFDANEAAKRCYRSVGLKSAASEGEVPGLAGTKIVVTSDGFAEAARLLAIRL